MQLRSNRVHGGTRIFLAFTALVLVFVWWLIQNWDDFNTRADGFAALLTFVFLIGAIIAKVIEYWIRGTRRGLGYLRRWRPSWSSVAS